jgi:septal ring factor EnvC (AmiA/AmiB activator)
MTPFLLVLAFTFATLFCVLWREAADKAKRWGRYYRDAVEQLVKRLKERDAAEMAVQKRNVELRALEEELKTVRGQLDAAVADRDRLHTELTSLKNHLGELAA